MRTQNKQLKWAMIPVLNRKSCKKLYLICLFIRVACGKIEMKIGMMCPMGLEVVHYGEPRCQFKRFVDGEKTGR